MELSMLVKIDILFALEFPGNYFLNAYNCFKAVLPLIRGESNNCTGCMKHLRATQSELKRCFYHMNSKAVSTRPRSN